MTILSISSMKFWKKEDVNTASPKIQSSFDERSLEIDAHAAQQFFAHQNKILTCSDRELHSRE